MYNTLKRAILYGLILGVCGLLDTKQWSDDSISIYIYIYIIESVDSISRDDPNIIVHISKTVHF